MKASGTRERNRIDVRTGESIVAIDSDRPGSDVRCDRVPKRDSAEDGLVIPAAS
jgi:hypothetical protein